MSDIGALLAAALLAASLLAGAVQGATGFGFAALAVPAFLLIMDSLAAIQVAAVVSLAMSAMLAPRLWRAAPRRLLALLAAGSVLGFPIGLLLYRAADVHDAKLAVGLLTAAFVAALALREWRGQDEAAAAVTRDEAPFTLLAIGMASGIAGAALAAPGPVVVLYLLARGVPKEASRAITLTLFAFCYAAVTALHALWGGMTSAAWLMSAALVPAALAGAAGGHLAARYLSERQFRLAALLVLAGAAAVAIVTSL